MNFTVGLSSIPSRSCSAPPPSATGKSFVPWGSSKLLSHMAHTLGPQGTWGSLGTVIKSMKKQMLLVSPKFIPKRQTKSCAM